MALVLNTIPVKTADIGQLLLVGTGLLLLLFTWWLLDFLTTC